MIHVRSLEDYNPGYKDRQLIWCKAYFKMINADPTFERLCEIDKWRFMAFVMMELQIKEPLPDDDDYWRFKRFDLKKRALQDTITALSRAELIEVLAPYNVTQLPADRNDSVTQIRLEKSRIEKNTSPHFVAARSFWMDEFQKEHQTSYVFQSAKDGSALSRLLKAVDLDEFKTLALWLIKTDKAWYCENRTLAVLGSKVNEIRGLLNKGSGGVIPEPDKYEKVVVKGD